MNVIIDCEFTGEVRDAFTSRGHSAVSCDLLPTERLGLHYQTDARLIDYTGIDLVIAFPPCTYLCSSGARWWKNRLYEQEQALAFILFFMALPVPLIAIESPIGCISTRIRRPDQIIQPWQFGHGEVKATCFWLKGLPLLIPTNIVPGRYPRTHYASPSRDRSKNRSRTYPGIASAMAEQWGNIT